MHRPFRAKAANPATRITRVQAIRKAASDLQRFSWPRLEMGIIVGLTGLAGFFASVLLLALDVEQMSHRYPLAVGAAYLVFLLQLWLWMRARDVIDDVPDPGIDFSSSGGGHAETPIGDGGSFGGGGASGSWDASSVDPLGSASESDSVFDSLGDVGGVADVADVGEGCGIVVVVLIVIALVASLLAGAIYFVSGAPVFLAELLVDGALSYGLYRNLRRQERGFWLFTAVRRTGLVFLVTAFVLAMLGAAMALRVPEAHTFGEFLQGMQTATGETSK